MRFRLRAIAAAVLLVATPSFATNPRNLPDAAPVVESGAQDRSAPIGADYPDLSAHLGGRRLQYPLPKWDAAKAAVQAGTRNAKLVTCCESTSIASFASAAAADYALAWGTLAAKQLPNNPSVDSFCGTGGTGSVANFIASDPRWTGGTSWVLASNTTLGAYYLQTATSNANPISFTPVEAFDTIDFIVPVGGSLGSFTVNVDGGSNQTISEVGGSFVMSDVKLTFPLGTHVINFTWASGALVYLGNFAVYNSAVKQVTTYVCGWIGSTASLISSTSGGIGSLPALAALKPDMTVIMLLVNDADAQTSVAAYISQMQSIINVAKATGDVIMMTDAPVSPAQNLGNVQSIYLNAYIQLANQNHINLINFYSLWSSWNQANANSWMAAGSPGYVHPNAAGYAAMAQALLPYLLR